MSDDEITERTLDSGEKVVVCPPCPQFPEGREVRVKTNALRDLMDSRRAEKRDAHAQLVQAHKERLSAAQESLRSGRPVPPEKRFL